MPTLIPAAFIAETNQPFVWACSDCQAVFSLERMISDPTISQLHKVDSDFRTHCKHAHPGSSVIGLKIKNPKEDVSQSAVRVVREATERE
jgi:hypothetical protein